MVFLPKPKRKDRIGIKRRKEIKKLDKLFQNAEAGLCAACHQWSEQRTKHHLLRRRDMDNRWNDDNTIILCARCHAEGHQIGSERFLALYGVPFA